MKNRKKVILCTVVIMLIILVVISIQIEHYRYRNVCNQFLMAMETKDCERMDEIFDMSAKFVIQNAMYGEIRRENMPHWDRVDYEVADAGIVKKWGYIDCISGDALLWFYIYMTPNNEGEKIKLDGSMRIEKMEDGSYKITQIDICDSTETNLSVKLFGEYRR